MFIDTHCHLSLDYYDDIDKVLNDNHDMGVSKIIVSGCDKKGIKESLFFVNKYSDIYASIGYHPDSVEEVVQKDLVELEEYIKNNKKVLAIGEIGLDYHYVKDNKDLQISLFERQLALSEKLTLPVVIHSRDATEDTIKILSKYKVKGVIHCFSGSLDTAKIYIKMGFKLGIGGVLTFKNSKLCEVVQNISLSDIVLETDSPYLAPDPFRGSVNTSKNIPIIAKKIADIKGISVEEVASVTSENAIHVFFSN
ncbi:MAG: TatD family hydrolase [Bacilli bacterium]|nr:TatD family hydrolase [Bacilli bacterium]